MSPNYNASLLDCASNLSKEDSHGSTHPTNPSYREGLDLTYKEWQQSAVSLEIVQRNVMWLSGDEATETILGHALSQMSGHGLQYVTKPVSQLLSRYEHVQKGGWWVSGLDPLSDWRKMDWGQFKPLHPRQRWDRPDRTIKYETPAKASTRAIFLDGALDWRAVQLDTRCPRIWTEGAKKAGAALTAGYAAIALPGVYSGYRSKDKLGNPVKPYLIADVEAMAQPESVHYLAFDQDEKIETRQKVAIAISRFGRLLQQKGCDVRVVSWSADKGKGIDDLIAAHGKAAFEEAINSAYSLAEFELWQALESRLTIAPTVAIKAHDLTTLSPQAVPQSGIIAIASAKGTGKTKLINELIARSDKALLAGHRISLMRNLSERCGVNYRGDLDKHQGQFMTGDAYTLRVGTCVDSLLAISPEAFRGCDLVIDEVCQVLRHLLTSSTCNQQGKRPVLLMRFRELLQTARRVILADADLDDKAITYIQQLRDDPGRPFLIRNDYKAAGYPVRFIESPDASAITGELLDDLKAGLRCYIAIDSRRGSKRISRLIKKLQVEVPQLLINSETSSGEIERQFMESPDAHLESFSLQAVTASPSAATGISIESNHFDKVYGIFYGGSITDADMSQALGRVRANVPRSVWCAKYGRAFSKAGKETAPLKLRNMLKQKYDANTLMIRASLAELTAHTVASYDWAHDPHIGYWAKIEAERNRSMWNLRSALKIRLQHEGNCLELVEVSANERTKAALQAAREELKAEQAIAIESADNLTSAEARVLEELDGLNEAQRRSLKKWQLSEFYCLPIEEITAELVLWDNDGRRRGQLLNLEGFLYEQAATDADVRALEKQTQWNSGITPWDISNAALKSKLRHYLNLDSYLEVNETWESASLTDFKAQALALSAQIKVALNFTVRQDMSAAQILNQLLEQMGLECSAHRHRVNGTRVRTYRIAEENRLQCMAVLSRRKERKERLARTVPPPGSNNWKEGDGTAITANSSQGSRADSCPVPDNTGREAYSANCNEYGLLRCEHVAKPA